MRVKSEFQWFFPPVSLIAHDTITICELLMSLLFFDSLLCPDIQLGIWMLWLCLGNLVNQIYSSPWLRILAGPKSPVQFQQAVIGLITKILWIEFFTWSSKPCWIWSSRSDCLERYSIHCGSRSNSWFVSGSRLRISNWVASSRHASRSLFVHFAQQNFVTKGHRLYCVGWDPVSSKVPDVACNSVQKNDSWPLRK